MGLGNRACHYCRSEKLKVNVGPGGWAHVVCCACGATGPIGEDPAHAVELFDGIRRGGYADGVHDEAIRRAMHGESCKQIARELGVNSRTVNRWAREAGVACGKAYSGETRAKALRALGQGARLSAVADELGVSVKTLSRWRKAAEGQKQAA